jgi:hypothetical protein
LSLIHRLRAISNFIPPSLAYFCPLFMSGRAVVHDSLGAVIGACLLEPASHTMLMGLLLPWLSRDRRLPLHVDPKPPRAAPSRDPTRMDADREDHFPTPPSSHSAAHGAHGAAWGAWGSAAVELIPVPEMFHLQPFKKLYPWVVSNPSLQAIAIGVLRSKYIHGAPDNYVVTAPDPNLELFAYCETQDRKRLPGDQVYILRRR